MEDNREYNWRGVYEDGEDKIMIHSLRWDVYSREKEGLINREFSDRKLVRKWLKILRVTASQGQGGGRAHGGPMESGSFKVARP